MPCQAHRPNGTLSALCTRCLNGSKALLHSHTLLTISNKIFTLWRLKFKIDNFIKNKKRMQQREDISVSGVYFNKAGNRFFDF